MTRTVAILILSVACGGSELESLQQTTSSVNVTVPALHKLQPTGAWTDAAAGQSLAIDGRFAVLGAPGDRENNITGAGAAYVYSYDDVADSWSLMTRIAPPTVEQDANFGRSVAIVDGANGLFVFVGTPNGRQNSGNTGAAYVFEKDEGGTDNWGMVKELVPSDGTFQAQFGFSIDATENSVVVGAPRWNFDDRGKAYVFGRNQNGADNWGEVTDLASGAGNITPSEYLGTSVAIDGAYIAVGAELADRSSATADTNLGAVDVWRVSAGQWTFVQRVYGASQDLRIGTAVAIDQSVLAIGAPNKSSGATFAGGAYLYQLSANANPSLITAIDIDEPQSFTRYGRDIALVGDFVLLGSDADNVLVHERNFGGANNWGGVATLTPTGSTDRFGETVAASGRVAFVGAPGDHQTRTRAGAGFTHGLSSDLDGDGVANASDNCLVEPNPSQLDSDNDGKGDECDICRNDATDMLPDPDGDTFCGDTDNCPDDANGDQLDSDGDGDGDACDDCPFDANNVDPDADKVCGTIDNCPMISNANQADADGDGIGDVCDDCPMDATNTDSDGDGFCAGSDNCPDIANPDQADEDNDDVGDVCDVCPGDRTNEDSDGDGLCGKSDNCPDIANISQYDGDGDGIGDACDKCPRDRFNIDIDGDGHCAMFDNCPKVPNPDQVDKDENGVGDACQENLPSEGGCSSPSGSWPLLILALLPLAVGRRITQRG